MPAARKISTRKVLQVLLTLVVTVACVLTLSSTVTLQESRKVSRVRFSIRNGAKCQFLSEAQLQQMLLRDRNYDPTQSRLGDLNLKKIESIIQANPWVSDAEVYVDSRSVLYVNVTQRVPVLRIFQADGDSYYLDSTLRRVPLSDCYVHLARVVSNAPVLHDDSAGKAYRGMLVSLCRQIDRDTFWNAQVSEVHCADDGELELVSVLGNHRILIGDTADLGKKLDHTLRFYRNVLNRVGWNRYSTLDLRFAGQVVAGPAIPVAMPRDKALSDMNWVKSIMGSAYHDSMMDNGPSKVVAVRDTHRVVKPAAPVAVTTPKPAPARIAPPKPAPHLPAPKPAVAAAPKYTLPAKTIAAKKTLSPAPSVQKAPTVKTLPKPRNTDIPRPQIRQQPSADIEDLPSVPAAPARATAQEPRPAQPAAGGSGPKYLYPGKGAKR